MDANAVITSNRTALITYNIVWEGSIMNNKASKITTNTGGAIVSNNILGDILSNSTNTGITNNIGRIDIRNNNLLGGVLNNTMHTSGTYSNIYGIINNTARDIRNNLVLSNITNNMLCGDISYNGVIDGGIYAPTTIVNNIIYGRIDADTGHEAKIKFNSQLPSIDGNICQGIYNNI